MTVCPYGCRVNAVSTSFSNIFCSGLLALFRYSPRMAPASVRNAASS